VWQIRSAKLGITGQAHAFIGAPQYKAVGNKGVMRFGLRGVPDKDIAFFIMENMQSCSNVLTFRKSAFAIGNAETIFQAAAAKLSASDRPNTSGQK
jgi:hypothetical protein